MSETRFTPGPWYYTSDYGGFELADHDGSYIHSELIWDSPKRKTLIAEVDGRTKNNCRANTSLIASAPELYAALENLLKASDAFDEDIASVELEKVYMAAQKAARAALSKARGETP